MLETWAPSVNPQSSAAGPGFPGPMPADGLKQDDAMVLDAIVKAMDLSDARTVADIGGGEGDLLAALLLAHRHLNGVLFDRADVIERSRPRFAEGRWPRRVGLASGDFLQAVGVDADVFLLKEVVRDWDDRHAGVILRNCREGLGKGGRLIVIERLLPEKNIDRLPQLVGYPPIAPLAGGRERAWSECLHLLSGADFKPAWLWPTAAGVWIVDAVAV